MAYREKEGANAPTGWIYGADVGILVSKDQKKEREKGREGEREKEEAGYEEESFDFDMDVEQIDEMAAQQGVVIRRAQGEDILGILELIKLWTPSATSDEAIYTDVLFSLYRQVLLFLFLLLFIILYYYLTIIIYQRHFPNLLCVCECDNAVIGFVAAIIESGSSIFQGIISTKMIIN